MFFTKYLKRLLVILVMFFMFDKSVMASTTGTVVVDDYLNVRNLVGGNIISKLGNGTVVTIVDNNAGSNSSCKSWYKITYGQYNQSGYACGDYISLLKGYASCKENNDPVNIWKDVNKSGKIASVSCDREMEILDKSINSNSKCSNNWYKVKYGNSVGYACSTYVYTNKAVSVSTGYGRPWTSPMKSIVGGAEFIVGNYISKGQHTSYLKKFNVNPKSSYSTYNHQYMANLAAPSSEAKSSYNSYKNNNLLNLPLHFIIPTYNNMPGMTALPGSNADTSGLASTDSAFEAKLKSQGFDESYKKKLRALHIKHSNWTFENLKTGLDFNKAVKAEQAVSSINLGTKYYYNNGSVQTEPGWYMANTETVSYYLDPRNFLNETYILMFESLKYSTNYTDNVVQSVINGTFMSGKSSIDNKNYATIFVDAGKSKDVSPVYLASLARQESGVNGSKATSGAQFTYKNVSYKGLYNFFNIGASSSEENPILAGLVWASGGNTCVIVGNSCGNTTTNNNSTNNNSTNNNSAKNNATSSNNTGNTNNSNANNNTSGNNNANSSSAQTNTNSNTTTTVANKGSNYYVNKLNVRNKSGYVNGISVGTTVNTILSKLSGTRSVSIVNIKGKGISGNSKIGTGSTITVTDSDGKTKYGYKVVMYGDVNGDGAITASDYVNVKNYIMKKNNLSVAALKGADSNKSGSVTASDYVIIKNYIMKKTNISQT